MIYCKIIYIVLLLCIIPSVSADFFNDTNIGDDLAEIEAGSMKVLMSAAGIFAIVSGIFFIVGAATKKPTLMKAGLAGFGILVVLAILFGWATDFFAYWTRSRW